VRDAFASFASRGSFDTLLRTMSSVGHMLGSPTSTMRRAGSMLFRDDFGIGLATSWLHNQQQQHLQQHLQQQQQEASARDAADAAGASCSGELAAAASVATATVAIPPEAPAPAFQPMFPWYSGTSADLIKTLFDLLISVRVFLGRFDMRTMQARLSLAGAGPWAGVRGEGW
jgi:hypothetical protein